MKKTLFSLLFFISQKSFTVEQDYQTLCIKGICTAGSVYSLFECSDVRRKGLREVFTTPKGHCYVAATCCLTSMMTSGGVVDVSSGLAMCFVCTAGALRARENWQQGVNKLLEPKFKG